MEDTLGLIRLSHGYSVVDALRIWILTHKNKADFNLCMTTKKRWLECQNHNNVPTWAQQRWLSIKSSNQYPAFINRQQSLWRCWPPQRIGREQFESENLPSNLFCSLLNLKRKVFCWWVQRAAIESKVIELTVNVSIVLNMGLHVIPNTVIENGRVGVTIVVAVFEFPKPALDQSCGEKNGTLKSLYLHTVEEFN